MLNRMILWQATIVGWIRDHFSAGSDTGASLVEYSLLLTLIAVVALVALQVLGTSASHTVGNVANTINNP
jgi:Flp pilus assembly pilin Flp